MTWLSAFCVAPDQASGTMMAWALIGLSVLMKAWPWSGPDAAIMTLGV